MSPGKRLRELVADSAIQVPGAPSALLARLIERLGYEAIYLSGAAFSTGTLGLPDVGLFTLSELVQQAGYLTRACRLPLIVDADTGFGDVLNVERTVIELRAAGAAAIQLEDQQFPKRCGHLAGKSLIEPAAMCAKLKAAVTAREDDELVLIARTDARGVTSLDDAIERAQRYLDAGADWIFPEALLSKQEFARFAEAIDAPLVANMTEFGKSPLLTLEELAELGYSVALYPVTLQRITMKACEAALNLIAADGTQADILDLMQTRDELYDLIDYPAFEDRDRTYSSDNDK